MESDFLAGVLESATDTKGLLIGADAIERSADLFAEWFGDAKPLVVADGNTWEAAGREVYSRLGERFGDVPEPYIFPAAPTLRPDIAHVDELERVFAGSEAIAFAVGAGTINDLVKLASHRAGKKYAVVATAASVDGYSSFGASILDHGFKTTIACPAPYGVIADTRVLEAAPREMTASGYADLVGKITAGADWLIADAVGIETIEPKIWQMVQPRLRDWISVPPSSPQDGQRVAALFEGLTVSALAMQAYRNTRPASGAEHLFSHLWEMEHLEVDGQPVSHGFKVGIGTLATTALLEVLFSRPLPADAIGRAVRVRPDLAGRIAAVRASFPDERYGDAVANASRSKFLGAEEQRRVVTAAASEWDSLSEAVRAQIIPYRELKALLLEAGCPISPEQIGVTKERLIESFRRAQMIRPRYTCLDFAYDLGLLDSCVQEIFSSHQYF